MRIQLTILLSLLSLNAFAVDDKSMQDLFKKFDSVVDDKKTELIDEVFTEKYIKDAGGKEKLISNIKEISSPKSKSEITWHKGVQEKLYMAKVKFAGDKSAKTSTFRVLEVNGKPKIDGTINDAD